MSRRRSLWAKKIGQVTQEKCEGAAMCKHSGHQKRYAHVVQTIPSPEVVRLALATVFPAGMKAKRRNLILKQFTGGAK